MKYVHMVLIPLSEYKTLVARDVELRQLEVCGVDNWSGYSEYNDITGEDGCQEVEDAVKECEQFIYGTPLIDTQE